MSTNTGWNPLWITEAISDTHVNVGTMTSPGPYNCLRAAMVIRFADEPELTKTLCFTPSQADHSCSNDCTWIDCVSTGTSSRRNAITASKSSLEMLFFIKGQ